ncbi:MAG: hypothetical protein RBU37_00590 [Myxococcota bacterium]|jgi:hypothetical protein|nr:hypothetical protein [Myxococcota bacterium]
MSFFALVTMTWAVLWMAHPAPAPNVPEAIPAQAMQAPVDDAQGWKLVQSEAAWELHLAQSDEATRLQVRPKGSFKVNLKYPWRFVGATQSIGKDAFTLTEQSALLKLPSQELPGELRFSVCDEHQCLLEKVQVKP